jgi:type 1 glutamine amidotransferase/sugar phosphate isomerase/epimerase
MALETLASGQTAIGTRVLKPSELPPSVSVRLPDQKRIYGTMVGVLGWRLGIRTDAFGPLTFKEAAAKADAAGLAFVEGVSTQKLTPGIPKTLDYNLSPDEVRTVQYRLLELHLGMPAYRIAAIPADEASRRKMFEFAGKLGVGTILSDAVPGQLADLDRLANEFKIDVAVAGRNPEDLMGAITGLSTRIGVSADVGAWLEQGIRPAAGLSIIKGRLMAVSLRDRSGMGAKASNVAVGRGVLDLRGMLEQIGTLEPPMVLEWPMSCTDCTSPSPHAKSIFFTLDSVADLEEAEKTFAIAVRPIEGRRVDEISRKTPITKVDRIPSDERRAIEAALPRQPLVKPKQPRKLLVVDLCVAAFYHDTIAHVNLAVELMGKNTGAYQAVFDNNLDNLKYPRIKDYDAVFLNNVGGAVFADPEVLDGLIRYIREGGGLAGFHGASYASQDLREFGELIGAQDGVHQFAGEPGVLKIDDPDSPFTKQFGGKGLEWYDEYFHFSPATPYSRDTLHMLLSVDPVKADLRRWHIRPDNDYGMVWVRSFGKGRVFNTALGHRPGFFASPDMARMVLGGIQFVLGDLDADTTPSSKLAARIK